MDLISADRLQVVQNAYVVRDLDESIERWYKAFGLGPFIVTRHLRFARCVYRGETTDLDMSAAFAQSGDLQIELICQHDAGPSAFRDMFGGGQEGLHHIAVFPDDHGRVVRAYRNRGFPVAMELQVKEGLGAVFIDTRELTGHMLEVYRDNGSFRTFYTMVADAARHWDGHALKIELDAVSP